MSEAGRSGSRLLRDSAHAASGRIASVLLWVVLTPAILSTLGPERFALWAIFLALTGYLTGLDLGIAQSTLRHVAAARASHDFDRVGAHATLGWIGYAALGAVWMAVTLLVAPAVLGALRIPAGLQEEGRIALITGAAVVAVSGAANVGIATLQGLGRFDLANQALLAALGAQGILAWISLTRGGGLTGLVFAVFAGWVVGVVVALVLLAARVPDFRWRPPRAALQHAREALSFGLPMQLTNLCALAHQHVDKFLLARMVTLAVVTPFELGFRFASAAATIPQQLLLALVPAVARLRTEGRDAELRHLYATSERFLMALTAVWLASLLASAPRLIAAWLGAGHTEAVMVARGLTVAWAIALTTGIGTSVARGIGRPDLEARFAAVVVIVHVAASLVLIPRLGLQAAVFATVLANAVGAAWFLLSLSHAMAWPRRTVLLDPFLGPALGAAAGVCAGWAVDRVLPPLSGAAAWAGAAGVAAAAAVIALAMLFVLGALRGEDVRRLRVAAFGAKPEPAA